MAAWRCVTLMVRCYGPGTAAARSPYQLVERVLLQFLVGRLLRFIDEWFFLIVHDGGG